MLYIASPGARPQAPFPNAGEVSVIGEHALCQSPEEGSSKFYPVFTIFTVRRGYEALFRDGVYQPLACTGTQAGHLCAFVRRLGTHMAVIFGPRLPATLIEKAGDPAQGGSAWADTEIELPAELGGERVKTLSHDGRFSLRAGQVLSRFPVALLLYESVG